MTQKVRFKTVQITATFAHYTKYVQQNVTNKRS